MVNVGSIGSSVGSILGWGIGLGLLAHTAKNVARTTDEMYRPRNRKRGYQDRPVRSRRTRPRSRMHRTSRMNSSRSLNIPNYWR